MINQVITNNKKPIKCWATNVDSKTLEQAANLANLPFTFNHVALMPDAHVGYGMPIGGVLATQGVVIPNAVGVDIGCGMCAVKTSLKEISHNNLINIVENIKKVVPVGFTHQAEMQDIELMPQLKDNLKIVNEEFTAARSQLGTLGGGNHFIEIQADTENNIWIMLHSGSRNLGKKVADYYNKIAEKLNEQYYSEVTKDKQLAFLPIETQEAKDYLDEMNYCVDFAYANRSLMIKRIKDCFAEEIPSVTFDETINIAHNYARFENHFNHNVLVHRKGATYAGKGQIGIIPGSQGTKSYIVEGLGNAESFMSCSHGSGRRLGRREAIKTLNLKDEINFMKKQNIINSIQSEKDLDEAPSAYKDITTVINNERDLIKPIVELHPLAVIKG